MAAQTYPADAVSALRHFIVLTWILPFAFGGGEAWAQGKTTGAVAMTAPAPICVLDHVPSDTRSRFVPPATSGKAAALTSTITVTFVGVSDPWPANAMAAFNYAKGLWEQTITSSQTIRVEAKWDSLSTCTGGPTALGSAGGNFIWRNLPGLPANTWFVDALADAITNSDLGGGGFPDINATFNSECDEPGASPDWYYGTDGMPGVGQVDFVSTVLHELGHGLGFAGAGKVTGPNGTVKFGAPADPYAYDTFTQDGLTPPVFLLNYPADPSPLLKDALEGQRGDGLFFNGTNANAANFGQPSQLYAPAAWQQGSSYSHLDETTFNGTTNALMTPALATMEAQHVIGGITCGIFEDQGWTIAVADCDLALPVELVSFDAIVDGSRVNLRWVTLSERDNAGFEVQHRAPAGSYRPVAIVEGAGSSDVERPYAFIVDNLEPGTHHFRLRQLDLDGSSTFGPEIAASIALDAAYLLTQAFPNPFATSTEFTLTARIPQQVRVELFDALGRRAAVLYEGPLMEAEPRRVRLESVDLPAGLYVVRAIGETFAASRLVVRAP